MSVADIKKGVSRLSVKERAVLAHWIIANLDPVAENEEMLDAAWRREVRARVNAIKSGKVQMIPATDMWKDLLADYAKTS